MKGVPELFGSMVFNEKIMQDKLPKDTFRALKQTMREGKALDRDVANSVATAMKDWAIELGATHFTHWFQPMTGITAEKHDSFITPTEDGGVIMEFSGKALIKGEPDASSFPSGGLRATFEARGYTAWDPTSYAFVKENTLYIPTAFCSYSGEVLDKKTPLLRSMEVISTEACRILHLFGKTDVKRVITTVGAEQEYFLIDKALYDKRPDLRLCGRTLFGAKSAKGQELEDHYFGQIKPRIKEFMQDLDEELWKLGILSKTEHNEVAPAQHEMAPIFSTTNLACDQNQLTMELLRKVAQRHGLACLLHEKPFAGVNGSGKHNNWSISTDTGENLLEPGKTPESNLQFLLFLVAVIKATDVYADLLRVSAAGAGNDHRLGANEAPPAIVSIFLGERLEEILLAFANETQPGHKVRNVMETGATVLPTFTKDTEDRNRTSSFAFTGNKFEFRALGAAASVASVNITLNAIVADVLHDFADTLEQAENFDEAVQKLIGETYRQHSRVVYNGNCYSTEWLMEAQKRGLLNLRTTADALPHMKAQKNIDMFSRLHIFSPAEVISRCEVLLENYIKVLTIEAQTMLGMVKKEILPACVNYSGKLTKAALDKKALCADISVSYETELVRNISQLCEYLYKNAGELELALIEAKSIEDYEECARYFSGVVFEKMCMLRQSVDDLETMVAKSDWPYPTYSDLLFQV